MKKLLSILMVAVMIVGMVPAFAITADEAPAGTTIADADAYIAMVEALNDADTTNNPASPINVTADLDFAGKAYTPINMLPYGYVLDFGGHAIENLNYEVEVTATSELGLIANQIGNSSEVRNLVLKNSSFTVKDADGDDATVVEANVGAIAGRLDRASATNISTDNFTITTDATGYVGLLAAYQHWGYNNYTIYFCGNLKDFTVNAPNATVGILTGWSQDWLDDGGMHVVMKDLTGNVTVTGAANLVTEDTLIANNALEQIYSEDAFVTGANQYYVDTASINIDLTNTSDIYLDALGFATIDSAEEFVEFAQAVNNGTVVPTDTVKVTADLDMTGLDYTPIHELTVSIDFDGHTVSNLHVNPYSYYVNWHGQAVGLIANFIANDVVISNLTLKNSSITVDDNYGEPVHVGGVVGMSDRGCLINVDLDGVKITSSLVGYVGGMIGCYLWSYAGDAEVVLSSIIQLEVDAPKATVGLIIGHVNDPEVDLNLKDVKAKVKMVGSANAVDETTFSGFGSIAEASTAENVNVTLTYAEGWYPIDEELKTIDSAEELVLLSERVNDFGVTYRMFETILVTADLDMTDIYYEPLDGTMFVLDFQGHTVSNLVVSLYGYENAGLIAKTLSNNSAVYNLKLKDCVLITDALNVGAVAGQSDRGSVDNITLENVTINATNAYAIGGLIGDKAWECVNPDMSAVMKDVTIYASANTRVGMLAGCLSGDALYGAAKINLTGLTVDGLTVYDAPFTAESYIGENRVVGSDTLSAAEHFTIAEDAVISVDLEGSDEPVVPDLPTETVRYEAEDGTLGGTAGVIFDGSGESSYSNGGVVCGLGMGAENYVEIGVDVSVAGEYNLVIEYAATENRSLDVSVNGGDYTRFATPAVSDSMGDTGRITVTVTLNAGYNTIRLFNASVLAPNIDYIDLSYAGSTDESDVPDVPVTPSETVRYEAEDGDMAGNTVIVADGLGEDVSGGAFVGSIGGDAGNLDSYLDLTVSVETMGRYELTIGYVTAQDRSIDVSVNGANAINVATPASGDSWTSGVATVTVTVTLNAGENVIRLFNSSGWSANIDYIEISYAGSTDTPVDPGVPGDVNGDGSVTMRDAVLVQQYLNGSGAAVDESIADVTGDGVLTMRDAVLIQQYLNGWDVELK